MVDEINVTSRNVIISNFFQQKVRENQKMNKKTFSPDIPKIVDLFLNPDTTNATFMWFSGLFYFQSFFGYFLRKQPKNEKNKFFQNFLNISELCVNNYTMNARYMLFSGLFYLQLFFVHFLLHTIRINETKVTSGNAFIANVFALESATESKKYKKSFFQDFPRIFCLSVYPYTMNATYKWCSGQIQF